MQVSRRTWLQCAVASSVTAVLASCSAGPPPATSSEARSVPAEPTSPSSGFSTSAPSTPSARSASPAAHYDQTVLGPLIVRTSPGADTPQLRQQVTTGWQWARRAWPGVAVPARVIVWVPSDDAQFRAWGGQTSESAGVAGSALADGSVLLAPGLASELTATGMSVVLAHEFSHVLLHQESDHTSPRWLIEGSAQWAAYAQTGRTLAELAPLVGAAIRAGTSPTGPPDDAAFSGTGELEYTYELAYVWCRYLVSRAGVRRWRQLVESGPTTAQQVRQVVAAWTGVPAGRPDPAYGRFLAREFA